MLRSAVWIIGRKPKTIFFVFVEQSTPPLLQLTRDLLLDNCLGFFCQRCCSGKITIRNDSIACVGTALPRQPSPRPQQQPPPVCQHRPLPDPPGQTRSQPHNGLPPPPLRPQPRLQPLSPQPLPPPRRARATLWASLCPRTRLLVCFPKFGTFVRKQPIFSDSCRNI